MDTITATPIVGSLITFGKRRRTGKVVSVREHNGTALITVSYNGVNVDIARRIA